MSMTDACQRDFFKICSFVSRCILVERCTTKSSLVQVRPDLLYFISRGANPFEYGRIRGGPCGRAWRGRVALWDALPRVRLRASIELEQAHKKRAKEEGCTGVISQRKFPDIPRRSAPERVPTMPEVAPDHTTAGCSLFVRWDHTTDLSPFCSFLDRYFPSPSPEKNHLLIVPKLSLLHRTC